MEYTSTPQRAWREVDLRALRRNFFLLRATAPDARICPVVKANAYGHGAVRLSRLYETLGAHALAFATVAEAAAARAGGVRLPLFVLGHADARLAHTLAAQGIIPTVHSPASARELSREAQKAGVTLPIQMKLDTGMGRLGFVAERDREVAAARAILKAARLPNIRAVGLFTHFSSADERGVGEECTKEQLRRFLVVRKTIKEAGLPLLAHAANSAATLAYPEAHLDMIRPGLALYGINPFSGLVGVGVPDAPHSSNLFTVRRGLTPSAVPLTPALTVKAAVTQIKWVKRGAAIGYGRAFVAHRAMRIATIGIGYADGLLRRHAACGGGVEVRPPQDGCAPLFLPFVGRISMDQCTVDATAAPFLRAGDAVTVLGESGRVSFSAAAARIGTIPYELFTTISHRVPIVYTKE